MPLWKKFTISAAFKVDKLDSTLDCEVLSAGHTFGWDLLFVLHLLLFLFLRVQHVAVKIVHWFGSVHEVLRPDNFSVVIILDLLLVAGIHRVSRLIRLEEPSLLLDGVRLHH